MPGAGLQGSFALPPSEAVAADARARALPPAAALALLAASGLAALVYQLLWVKQLSLVVGVEVYAVTTAVSAFFLGLGLGGWWLGRVADRVARPLRLYALIELGVALLAVVATLALAHAAPLFVRLQQALGAPAWCLPFLLVGVPAVPMGGTLPVLMAALGRARRPAAGDADPQAAAAGGRLYAANTAGAIVGALLAPFVLIPWLGVQGSAWAAAAINALAALAAFALDRGAQAAQDPSRGHRAAAASAPAHAAGGRAGAAPRAALAVYALAGGVALGYEVVWSQAIVQFMSTRAFAFAIVLATYLAGLVIGSALAARWAPRVRDPWAVFGALIAAAGLVALLQIVALGPWLPAAQARSAGLARALSDAPMAAMSARFAVAGFSIVFVPTLLLGAAFPMALRLVVARGHAGRDVGRVLAWNTLGGIGGTLLVGFVLVPVLGLVHALAALALAAAALGAYAALRGQGAWRIAAFALAGAAVLAALLAPADRLATLLAQDRGGKLVAYEESRGGTVAVIEQGRGTRTFKRLYIQGVSNSGDAMTSRRYMRLQALLPLMLHGGEPKSALVIGLGTGITGGALLAWPGLEQRVVAELLPAVLRAAPHFQGNYALTTDPRMTIRISDGRRELLARDQRYDLITLEPPPPSAAGVVNLYSTEFYRLAAARLRSGGLVAQWLPLTTQNDADARSLVASFLAVFPHATLWTTELHEMLLVGSFEPIELDVPRVVRRFGQPEVAAALREVGIASPAALLATWVTDRAGLQHYAAGAAPVSDDRPRIEYAPWVRPGAFPIALTELMAEYVEPPLRGADAAFADAVRTEAATLHAFYRAGLATYTGDRDAWAREMNRIARADPGNPYYRWFGGSSAPNRP